MLTDIQLNPTCAFLPFAFAGETCQLRKWGKREGARALVLLVHGLGAESAWFEAAARELACRGFLVFAYDQRGFGSRSATILRSYKEWLEDLLLLARHLRATHANLPVYVLGNSMGALVVMAAAASLDLDGIIISSPGFDGDPHAFTFFYKLKAVVTALLAPGAQVALPYSLEIVARHQSVKKWLAENAPAKPTVPGSMLFELSKLSSQVLAGLKTVKAPLLMFTAGQDRVVNNSVSEKVFEALAAPSKKHICLEEAWHDLMFDPLVDEIAGEIVFWQNTIVASLQPSGRAIPK
jgi:acylglycerol lipase